MATFEESVCSECEAIGWHLGTCSRLPGAVQSKQAEPTQVGEPVSVKMALFSDGTMRNVEKVDLSPTGEVRVTDPVTGGAKGQKPAQLGTVDPLALLELAKVGGVGAVKYSRYNYLRGFAWSLGYDALQRHLLAYQSGEDVDPESGLPHLAHAMWHCSALLSFQVRGLGTDDRPPPVSGPVTHTLSKED